VANLVTSQHDVIKKAMVVKEAIQVVALATKSVTTAARLATSAEIATRKRVEEEM